MICDECIYWAGDSADNCIRFICGHHPKCPNFSINKELFMEYFNKQVQMSVVRQISSEKEKLKSIPQTVDNDTSSAKITRKLYSYLSRRYFPIASNCYIYNWESDLIAINANEYITEYEIKISRHDYKADFKKDKKHQLISDSYQYNCNAESIPNYFYYVTPPGLLDKSEIPIYSGLIEVGLGIRYVKRAPILHKLKMSDEMKIQLLKKVYYKYWNNFTKI